MPPRRLRLDAELVRRGLARSREHASELVAERRVTVSGVVATKPATGVTTDVAIVVREDPDRPAYVSRGGHKLAGALAAFAEHGLVVEGARCLDAGASTGGFTDVLLRNGAREVVAVDVGYGQLVWRLRSDADQRVKHELEADEREVAHHEVDGLAHQLRRQLPDVGAVVHDDAVVTLQRPGQLAVPHVDRHHLGGAAPEQHVGEAARRRPGVERPAERWH